MSYMAHGSLVFSRDYYLEVKTVKTDTIFDEIFILSPNKINKESYIHDCNEPLPKD